MSRRARFRALLVGTVVVCLLTSAIFSGCSNGTHNSDLPQTYLFTTYAGIGVGHKDGHRFEARFGAPEGIAIDDAGNLYVTEYRTTVVRKIDAKGRVTTLGGSGEIDDVGARDGGAKVARFNRPHGIDVGPDGTVYVSDMHNHAIRKIVPSGEVTTYAGKLGDQGHADGDASEARFQMPEDVALDSKGNLYVADTYNYTVRKVAPDGMVVTLAGKPGEPGYADGPGNQARFNKPIGIAVDGRDRIFVADANYDGPEIGNCVIRMIDSEGVVSTYAGRAGEVGPDDGPRLSARFHKFVGIDVTDDGVVYVADTEADTIRRIDLSGRVETLGGTYLEEGRADGNRLEVRFKDPQALVVDKSGRIYIADTLNNRIVVGVPVDDE